METNEFCIKVPRDLVKISTSDYLGKLIHKLGLSFMGGYVSLSLHVHGSSYPRKLLLAYCFSSHVVHIFWP